MPDSILSHIKPCNKCGGFDRNKRNVCDPCEKERLAKRYIENKEKIADAQRARIAKDPQKKKEASARYATKNRKELSRKQAIYNAANKERLDAARKLWVSKNKDKVKETRDRWIANNKDVRASYNHNRRARRIECGGSLSPGIRKKLLSAQGGKCPCCGKPLGDDFHLDHIVPLALGGSNTDDNVQLLRAICNLEKSTKHPIDYMQSKGFLL